MIPSSTSVGFIGLGVMGRPMAHNLLSAGYRLCVHDLNRDAVAELADEGATACHSSREAAEGADIVITMLPDSPHVESVIAGENGVLVGVNSSSIVIDMSTISPIVTRRLSSLLAEKGVPMLDAPVSGGEEGARAGTLSIMVGGPADTFRQCAPLFDVLGAKVVYMGDSGAGQVTKACNQIVIGVTIQAIAEAFLMARKMGVDPAKVREALLGGAGRSDILERKGPRMLNNDYAPGFRTNLHLKDLGIALETGRSVGVPLLTTSLVNQLMTAAVARGLGDSDNTVLARLVEELSSPASAEEHLPA